MTTRYKPGSRVQAVWEVFDKSGGEAAFNHGITLSLAATTLKSWVRMWEKEKGNDGSPTVAKAKLPTDKGPKPVVNTAKPPIKVSYSKRPAHLMEQGPQVSVIRWADDGSLQALSNEHLGLPVIREDRTEVRRWGGE